MKGCVPGERHAASNPRPCGPALLRAGWSLGAPAIILGGIISGVCTATEAAAVAVVYAFLVGLFAHRELDLRRLPALLLDAAVTSGVVMSIIAAASLFGWVMAIERIPAALADAILAVGGEGWMLLLAVNILLLLAGTMLETTAALILLVPVLVQLLPRMGIDLIHLGVIVVMNLSIGMLTPPLGVCLMVSCGIARVPLATLARAVLPLLAVLVVDLMLVTYIPWFVAAFSTDIIAP